jgi:hypothetical protein
MTINLNLLDEESATEAIKIVAEIAEAGHLGGYECKYHRRRYS